MKITDLPEKKAPRAVYITLLSITGVLIILLIAGTIIGLARHGSEPIIRFGNSEPQTRFSAAQESSSNIPQAQGDDIRIYSGLERFRITLADSSIMILSISFPYSASDIAFTEELAAKVNDFKIIAGEYFQSLSGNTLNHIDEEAAKREILRRFNNNLRLGRINALYFHDLMIIDAL